MALEPRDSQHALQIQAGTIGRKKGHSFEIELADTINSIKGEIRRQPNPEKLVYGDISIPLINKALDYLKWNTCDKFEAIALGALATAEEGKKWLKVHGVLVRACKSDILLTLYNDGCIQTVGVSVKQCNNSTPTNDQLFFTTARAFCDLLQRNGIPVSDTAIMAMRQFCGDEGFRPLDKPELYRDRRSDPRRFFWEELDKDGREELESIFENNQDEITRLLLQKAYLDDPFTPALLIHKTKKMPLGRSQEFALYSIDELVKLSHNFSGFVKRRYSVRKGTYKDQLGIEHDAPRFGIVQMQRGGQAQHPTQLQFNLQAGYFYHI